MATLDELTEEVLSHQFSPSQYDSFVRAKINEAEKRLCAEIDFRYAFSSTNLTLSSGVTDYFLPADFQRIYTMVERRVDGSNKQVIQTPRTELDLLDNATTGSPERYAVGFAEGSNLVRFWPEPDGSYTVTVRYYGEPGSMTDGADTPLIPERWQNLLVRAALIECYERENDYNSAQYHQGVFDRDKEKAKGEAQYDSDDYSQATQVGDSRTDPLAPTMPYRY